jgi:hypothetical protein
LRDEGSEVVGLEVWRIVLLIGSSPSSWVINWCRRLRRSLCRIAGDAVHFHFAQLRGQHALRDVSATGDAIHLKLRAWAQSASPRCSDGGYLVDFHHLVDANTDSMPRTPTPRTSAIGRRSLMDAIALLSARRLDPV